MTAHLPIEKAAPLAAAGKGWRTHLTALCWVAAIILILFLRDMSDIVTIWFTSSTFNHCTLILPIIGWLVWQRLPELRQLQPSAWWPGLLLAGAGAGGWLLGEAGGLALARHAGVVFMLQGAVIACLGKAGSRGLAFPIFYALFLIPAGEEIVPLMQTVTAEMCMFLLALVGIPAHIEGVFISIPTGYFEVAAACSGVKFLIAMVAYGALVANVCFSSWRRRAAFMAAAIAIPILANGIRAWGTIYVAHLTSVEFAVGLDHVIYGWIFFAIVIALIMAAGWRFFDRRIGDRWFDPQELQRRDGHAPSNRRLGRVTAALIGVAALPLAWSAGVASASEQPAVRDIVLPQVPGWQRVSEQDERPWLPHFAGADALRVGRYRNAAGQEVDLAVAVFHRQREGAEIVGYGQGAIAPGSDWSWSAQAQAPAGGVGERITSFGTMREVVTFYRVGSILTGSGMAVKLETMKTRLLGGPQRAVAVLVSAEAPGEGVSPRPAIDAFLSDLGAIDTLADRAAGLPEA